MFLAVAANLDMPLQNALMCIPTATETQEYELPCRRRPIQYNILRLRQVKVKPRKARLLWCKTSGSKNLGIS